MRGNRRAGAAALSGVVSVEDLPWTVVEPLAAQSDRVRVRAGTEIGHEGRTARELVVVVAGRVVASRGGEVVATYGPGAQLGGFSLVHDTPLDVTLAAATDTDLLVVNGPAYRWAARRGSVELPRSPVVASGS